MNTSFIIAVALSVAVVIVILVLAAALVYCRWRNTERMTSLGEFIRQNLQQKQMIDELKREIERKQAHST